MTISYAEPFPVSSFLDRGLSNEAHQVSRVRNDESAANSFYTIIRKNHILNGLRIALAETAKENLESYEAFRENPTTLSYALEFLSYLSPSMPFPEIAIDKDGEIVIEWDYEPRRIISVRVGKDGTLSFAWLVGYSSGHGVETLKDNIPDSILLGLKRVINTASH